MNLSVWWHSATVLAQTTVGQTSETGTTHVQSIWDFLTKGGPMMIPIGICSLVALAVTIERLITVRRSKVIPAGLLDGVRGRFKEAPLDPDEAIRFCRDDGSPLANVFLAGLKKLQAPFEQRDRCIQEAGERELFGLRRYLRLLSVIAAIAPIMGLLGTVFGLIMAFQTVSVSGEALGKTELLAKGIYVALITTLAGLMLAIPVLVVFHWLSSRIERLLHEMDRITVEFFDDEALPAVEAALDAAGPRLAEADEDADAEPVETAAARA